MDHKVTEPPSTKALGLSLEKIQQLFQRLKLSSLSQSFSSTAPSDADLGESLPNIPVSDSDERDDTSVCSGDYSTDGGYRSSTWDQGDILRSGSATSLEEVLEAPALGLASPELCYEAESPDEAALVHAAHAYSFTLVSRTPEQVTVRLPQGTCLTFDVLCTLGFDSIRKRMSVVVRHPLTREIVVYTKGADSVIMDLLEDPACSKSHLARAPWFERQCGMVMRRSSSSVTYSRGYQLERRPTRISPQSKFLKTRCILPLLDLGIYSAR